MNRGALPGVVAGAIAFVVGTVGIAKLGASATLFASVGAVGVLIAAGSRKALATLLLVLAPLPPVDSLLGVHAPVGLEPFTCLAAIGILMVLTGSSREERHHRGRPLALTVGLFAALYAVAWMRTYGTESLTPSGVALLVKPISVLAAGWIALRLVAPEQRLTTLSNALAIGLLLVGASVVLQKIGLYQPASLGANEVRLGIKKFGGVLPDGNAAGVLIGVFTMPAFLLLRQAGRTVLPYVVVASAVPVLLITLARGAMVAFAATILAWVIFDSQRVRNAIAALGLLAGTAAWALTAGRGQLDQLTSNLERYSGDTNATLSGREEIWSLVSTYLTQDKTHLWFGGGLDNFKAYALTTTLRNGFASHNSVLASMVTGGVIMTASFLAVVGLLLWAGGMADEVKPSMRVAAIGFLIAGMSADVTLYAPVAAWLLAISSLGYLTDSMAATSRSAIAGTDHGARGAAMRFRTS